jgi:glycosyltransferase involved in cell wall biosynthesis
MIVKNEEKVLKRCLESVKDYVDEIIIADTGSTDNTKNIALSYTKDIYDFEWINDFSAARNFVQSKAMGKWIIYLDADEYVDGDNMKDIIHQLKNKEELNSHDALVVTQINFVGTLAGNVTQCPTTRIYKNDPSIQFQRKIHEQLHKEDRDLSIGFVSLNIYHSGYLSNTFQEKNKTMRNVALIQSEIEKNSNNGFDHYNLGNEFLAEWRMEEALASYRNAFQLAGTMDILWVPMAVERIIFCLLELKRYTEALDVIKDAINQWPNAGDYRSQRALIYYMQHRFEDAETEIRELVHNKQKYTTIQSLSYLDYLPYFILGRISEYKNDRVNAVYNYSQALNYNDKDIDTLKRFYPLLVKNESKENIIEFLGRNDSMKNDINRTYLFKVLLDIGAVDLVDYHLKEWRITAPDGFKVKLNIGKGKFNVARAILNKNSINELLDEGWVDEYDILMLAVQLEKVEIFHQVLDCQNGVDFKCLEFLFTKGLETNVEDLIVHITQLLERCISLKNYNLIDKIIPLVMKFNIQADIGDVFYENGFKEIAIGFYGQLEDYQIFNEQSYVNIIEWYLQNNNKKESLKWAYAALNQGCSDFRIFNAVIQLLKIIEEFDDLEKIVGMALEVFPDSNYLQGFTQEVLVKN